MVNGSGLVAVCLATNTGGAVGRGAAYASSTCGIKPTVRRKTPSHEASDSVRIIRRVSACAAGKSGGIGKDYCADGEVRKGFPSDRGKHDTERIPVGAVSVLAQEPNFAVTLRVCE